MKFEVEWKSSHYHSDGRRRSRPKASTWHGWLVKWRATFSGNESLRREGMREMREAKATQEYKRQRKLAKRDKNGRAKSGLLSLFGFGNVKKKKTRRPDTLARGTQRSTSSRQAVLTRPPPVSRRPTGQSSRQPSYNSSNSRRDVARMKSSKK
ncbi:uncharacterized protein EDB91DRAFT_526445 [Suillus paluster]|uniref:uncharacterized protein n=1 Tax=Suillus paluster TaxID=48578 RepID=UPI001B8628CA|nr:uncharacterized protein EDB91DRAFT_526445 [Suillus paluster]KAG1752611.1 hypothetical protein EDB91DRAFT_526445 [Suillus paluster]